MRIQEILHISIGGYTKISTGKPRGKEKGCKDPAQTQAEDE